MEEIALKWVRRGRIFGRAEVVTDQVVTVQGIPIPPYFKSDGASLPWFVRSFLSPFGDYFTAALVHDFLLKMKVPRVEAAHTFKAELKHLNMPNWLTNTFYWGVRTRDHVVSLKEKLGCGRS